MSEVENAGKKGYCLLWGFVALFLFFILIVAIYQYNFLYLPE